MIGLEWLKQRIVSLLLSRYVGRWIRIDQKQLHAQTQGKVWTLTADDLSLKEDCLDNLGLPVAVRSGTIKKFTLVWRDKGPAVSIKINVDTIFVVLQSADARQLSPQQLRAAEQKAKRALLESWEAQLDSSFASLSAAPGAAAATCSTDSDADANNSLFAALLRKLEVSITNVTLCYYDAGADHTFGVGIDELAFSNTAHEQSGTKGEQVFKTISMNGLSVFLDEARAPASPAEAFMQVHSYLLHPASVQLTVGYDRASARVDVKRPKITLQAAISSVCLQLRRRQLSALVTIVSDLAQRFGRVSTRQDRPGRPGPVLDGNAAAWWRYARDLILEEVRERRRWLSASYMQAKRHSRLRYTDLYVKKRADALSKKERAELEATEEAFSLQELVLFRCLALKQVKAETSRLAQRKRTPWYRRMIGARAADPDRKAADGDGEEEEEEKDPLRSFSEEERDALLAGIDASPGGGSHNRSHNHLFRFHAPEQHMYSATLSCDQLSVRLTDEANELDASAALSLATVQVEGKAKETALKASMDSLVVSDVLSGSMLCRQTGRAAGHADGAALAAEEGGEGEGGVQLLTVAIRRCLDSKAPTTSVCARVAELVLMFDPVTLQRLMGFWEMPDPMGGLQVAARYARQTYTGIANHRPLGTIEGVGGWQGEGDVGTAAEGEIRQGGGSSITTGERISLDICVAAPTICLAERVVDAYKSSSSSRSSNSKVTTMLVVRLGQLSLQDADAEGRVQGQWGAAETAACNEYRLLVAQVGIDLMRHVEMPPGDDFGRNLRGTRVSIMQDTRLIAKLALELSKRSEGGSGGPSDGSSGVLSKVSVEADLEALNVHARAADLTDILGIAASWSTPTPLASARCGAAGTALMSGWLLVKRPLQSDCWCWRWVRLHSSALICSTSDKPGAEPEEVFPLDVAPVVAASINGVKVLVLPVERGDDGVAGAGARQREDMSGWGTGVESSAGLGKDLLLHAGVYVTQWQQSIREAQMRINPLLDGETTLVARPQVVFMDQDHRGAARASLARRLQARQPLAFNVKITAAAMAVSLDRDDGSALLQCRLEDVSSMLVEKHKKEWTLSVARIRIGTAASDGRGLRNVLTQRASPDTDAQPLFFKAEFVREDRSQIAHMRVQMQAMDVCFDDAFVNQLLLVRCQASEAWFSSRLKCRGGHERTSPHDSPDATVHASTPAPPPSIELFLSPRSIALSRSGRCCSLKRSQAPVELFGSQARRLTVKLTFVTQGMSMGCEDNLGNCILKIKMSDVDFVKEKYSDGSAAISGSLGGLHVVDTFAHGSAYERLLTVSKHADKMVRVDLSTFDFYSIAYPGYDKNVSVAIMRPEITLLFRAFGQLNRYCTLFGLPKEAAEAVAMTEEDSLVERGLSVQTRGPTRMKLVLEHPVLILPRSSLSSERIVADLGMIEVKNVRVPAPTELEEPTEEWQVGFSQMKLETISESGHSLVVTDKIDGSARITFKGRQADAREAGLQVEVSLGEVVGKLTEAQYGLLLSAFGQNMSEQYVNSAVSSAVNGTGMEDSDDWAFAKEITFKQLSEQIQQALSGVDLKRIAREVVINVERLNLAVLFAGDAGLSATSTSLVPLLQAVGSGFLLKFSIIEQPVPAAPENLSWQLHATFAALEVKDERPAMASRSLSFISTAQKSAHACFVYILNKTSSGHICMEIESRNVEIVADAGLLLRFLGWLGQGGRWAQSSTTRRDGDFHYVVRRPMGLAVRTTLSDARIHLVKSFQEAKADGFVVEGAVSVYYAQVFQKYSITARVQNMIVASHYRRSMSDPRDWDNVQITKPCSACFKFAWSQASGCEPSTMSLDSSGFEAVLSHRDVSMLSVVLSTLSASLNATDERGHLVEVKHSQKKKPEPQLLEIQAEIGTLACQFVAKSDEKPWAQVKIQCVTLTGKRMLDLCYRIKGSLRAIQITDTSVRHTRHPDILTGNDGKDATVAFEIATYDPASSLYPGHGVSVKLSVESAKITLLWRFVASINSYIASFRHQSAALFDRQESTLMPGGSPLLSSASLPQSGGSSALPFEMPPDFSPFDLLEERTDGGKRTQPDVQVRKQPDTRSNSDQAKRVHIEVELHHPALIIPRNSLAEEAFVADLGKIEVHNSVRQQTTWAQGAVWQVSLHNMRLDSRSPKGKVLKFVDQVDGSARLTFQDKSTLGAGVPVPGLTVDINLQKVRGCLSDTQYGLLLSVFGQNFSEQVISEAALTQTLHESTTALPKGTRFARNLAEVLGSAKAASAALALNAVYNIDVAVVELLLETAEDLETAESGSLMLITGEALSVRYEILFPPDGYGSGVEDIDTFKQERLVFGSRWRFNSLTILDKSSQSPRAKPFVSVTPNLISTAQATGPGEAGAASSHNFNFSRDIAHEHGAFVLRMFKTYTSHSFIELVFREVEALADAGLLMKLFRWIGRGGQISCKDARERVSEFQYKVSRPGALWVQTTLPRASINLVTSFEAPDQDRVVVGGHVDVHYATFGEECSLSVDIKDFTLTSHSAQRQTSNATMEIVTPCIFTYRQDWYTQDGRNSDSTGLRQPRVVASAENFNAMVTYEDMLLACRIAANLSTSLGAVESDRRPQPPDDAVDTTLDVHDFEDCMTPDHTPLAPPDDNPAAAEATPRFAPLQRAPTVSQSEWLALEDHEDPTTKPKQVYQISISGNYVRLTLVDDYNGRWIPLMRLIATDLMVTGKSDHLTSTLELGIDFFHQATYKWKPALEPWDVQLQYFLDANRTVLSIEDHSLAHSHVETQRPTCNVRLSGAAIESMRFAVNSWTQDRRTLAILNAGDSNQASSENAASKASSSSRSDAAQFVPYTVRNLLAEALICILEDGEEHLIEPQRWLELTYQQVWRRRGAQHHPRSFDREQDMHGTGNHVCLQLAGSRQAFCKVSVEIEQATSYVIAPADLAGSGPPFPLHIVCDLSRCDGQKILSVSSMVTVMNGSKVPVMSGILAPDKTIRKIGVIATQGALAVPLDLSRDGTLLIQPVVDGLDYQWCAEKTEAISMRSIHDGSVRITQAVDMKFQRLFGASFPADTTLLSSYACANDVDGVLWQGVLYVTDFALCHYSNLIGGEMKAVIKLCDVVSLRKVNTALVFPNAVEVKTGSKTFCFRTLGNREDAFRCILKVVPNKKVVVRDDDVDDRAKHVFHLEPGDVVLAMYTGMLHHGESTVQDPTGVLDGHHGYILLTTHHLLFMKTDYVGELQIPWAKVEKLEKKARNMVRNNAVLVQAAHGQMVILSSTKWNRDKVFDDDLLPLWKAASVSEGDAVAAHALADKAGHYSVSTRCRTMTCDILRAHATLVQNDPPDKNAVYARQKVRARDALTWTVVCVDAVTKKAGSERTVGNPCIVELHAPWVVENLSSTALEVQFIDQTRSCIVSAELAAGGKDQVLGVDLRREVFLRLRMPMVANKTAAWSEGFLIHTDSGKNEFEGLLEVADPGGRTQPVVVEVSRDSVTCGFRVTLYNRYWMLNLSGLPLTLRKTPASSYEAEVTKPRVLPVGAAIGYDVAAGQNLEIRAAGFQWSAPLSVERESGESARLRLAAVGVQHGGTGRDTPAVPNHELWVDVSSSTAAAKFDRTIVITFAPEIIIENHSVEPLVIWQRTPTGSGTGPTLWLDPGQALPLFPEGSGACNLSVNMAAEDVRAQCAVFEVDSSAEPLLLQTSDGKLLVARTRRLFANTGTVLLSFREPTSACIPHKIANNTDLSLAFQQKDSNDKSMQVRVGPFETVSVVWPEPSQERKVLQLVEIEGCSLSTSNAKGADLKMDSVQRGAKPVFESFAARNLKALLDQWTLRQQKPNSNGAETYVLRLARAQHPQMYDKSAATRMIELRDFGKFVLGRDPAAEEPDECLCTLERNIPWISRRHLRLLLTPEGRWQVQDLASTNGVFVNGERVESRLLQDGDEVRIGGTYKGADGSVCVSRLVYIFEKLSVLQKRRAKEACALLASIELDGGTKVMRLESSQPRHREGEQQQPAGTRSTQLKLKSKGLCLMIQDDDATKTEELLFLQLDGGQVDNGVELDLKSEAHKRTLKLKVDRVQLDNQFDARTPFPVVMSIAPPTKCGPAFELTITENLAGRKRERGLDLNKVVIRLADPYVFAEDRLIAKMAAFVDKFRRQQATRATLSPSSAASCDHTAATHGGGISDELASILALVCHKRASDVAGREGGGGQDRWRSSDNDAQVQRGDLFANDAHVYVGEIDWQEWRLHFTLMLTGDDNNKVLRRYCGRIVERMLRRFRIDDFLVSFARLHATELNKTQKDMSAWLSERMMQSARKSFFSSKFLLKGLDAYKDAFIGKQANSQKAQHLVLRRNRPVKDADMEEDELAKKPSTSASSRALGTVGRTVGHVAVGTVSAGVSVAGSVATTAASTAGVAAGFVAQTVADTVQGTPLYAATSAASTAKSAATSAASIAKSGVKAGFKKLGNFFS